MCGACPQPGKSQRSGSGWTTLGARRARGQCASSRPRAVGPVLGKLASRWAGDCPEAVLSSPNNVKTPEVKLFPSSSLHPRTKLKNISRNHIPGPPNLNDIVTLQCLAPNKKSHRRCEEAGDRTRDAGNPSSSTDGLGSPPAPSRFPAVSPVSPLTPGATGGSSPSPARPLGARPHRTPPLPPPFLSHCVHQRLPWAPPPHLTCHPSWEANEG